MTPNHKLPLNIYHCFDNKTGLNAYIGVVNKNPHRGIGGCRVKKYLNEDLAKQDLISLVSAMHNKSKFNNINLCGAKCVINATPQTIINRKMFFQALGRFIEKLGGEYIAAMDSGITQEDMNYIAEETSYVTNHDIVGGEPSKYTAEGIYRTINILTDNFLQIPTKKVNIAIQGIGNVGNILLHKLLKKNYNITITDIKKEVAFDILMQHPQIKYVAPDIIYDLPCDFFVPCALGQVINHTTVKRLRCKIICGAANNQLSCTSLDKYLYEKGILYIPDEIINCGGLMYCTYQYFKNENLKKQIYNISSKILELVNYSRSNSISPLSAIQKLYNIFYYNSTHCEINDFTTL
ncbi:MAG: Glu/Leu/Phe/Val dehydrogenase [Rickettsiales bacterium]|nr:Glu/Leu/Phe/Val dehydrogenase [Rickettsiales bacterium]